MQDSINRWWLPAIQLFGPDSRLDDPLLRWNIKSERNEVLRERYIQKFVPQLLNAGFKFRIPVCIKIVKQVDSAQAISIGSLSKQQCAMGDLIANVV